MLGLFIYAFFMVGLGCYLTGPSRSGLGVYGLRLAVGYTAVVILLYIFVVLAGVGVREAFWIVCAISMGGLVYGLRACRWRVEWRTIARHPAGILLIAGGVAVLHNGGIGYLPVGHDEFSHWLGNPLRLNAFGDWSSAVGSLNHPGYTPGWPLLISLPWQPLAQVKLGASAAAPFVLHVAVIAFVFDLVVFVMRRRLKFGAFRSEITGWGIILLFLAAEALGPLWSTTLLIEPPQILGYSIFVLLLFATEIAPEDERMLEFSAGIVLASCYLIKAAAMLFVPALVVLLMVRMFARGIKIDRIRGPAISFALLTFPILITAASWGFVSDVKGCAYSAMENFTPEAFVRARGLDWVDLANRYFTAVWDYISIYKTPLTIAGLVGLGGALARGAYRVPLVLVAMGACYIAILYWYHLTCFGAYYFENLNSIPRFTRVLLRLLHGVGLILFVETAVAGVARLFGTSVVRGFVSTRGVGFALVLPVVLLGLWQVRQVHRSVDTVTTRSGQSLDPRIEELRQAAAVIERLKGERLPERPVLLVISQGLNSAVLDFAYFFALSRDQGDPTARYRVVHEHSWSPEPQNIWQSRAGPKNVLASLGKADMVWPIDLDPWIREILKHVVKDKACLRALPEKALIRATAQNEKTRFSCINKTGKN